MNAIQLHRAVLVPVTAAVGLLALLAPASARESGTGLEVAEPRQIEVVVEPRSEAAASIGLTDEGIAADVRDRLRRAGLEPTAEHLPHYLLVDVDVVGKAFTARVAFARAVTYRAGGKRYRSFATTWTTAGTGLHGRDPAYIHYVIATLVNEFLGAYLPANFEAERIRMPETAEPPGEG